MFKLTKSNFFYGRLISSIVFAILIFMGKGNLAVIPLVLMIALYLLEVWKFRKREFISELVKLIAGTIVIIGIISLLLLYSGPKFI